MEKEKKAEKTEPIKKNKLKFLKNYSEKKEIKKKENYLEISLKNVEVIKEIIIFIFEELLLGDTDY